VTVKLPAVPAVVGDGKPATTNVLAAAALTTMPAWVPLAVPVSVAVSDCSWTKGELASGRSCQTILRGFRDDGHRCVDEFVVGDSLTYKRVFWTGSAAQAARRVGSRPRSTAAARTVGNSSPGKRTPWRM
jgi:hypothetical protein